MFKKISSSIVTIILMLILLLGIALIFINPIQSFLVTRTASDLAHDHYSVDDIQENHKAKASFEFETVQSLSIFDVLKAQANKKDLPVIGSIVIPSVDLQLPILKGVSNDVLAVGAGTMKPNQQLGDGNYALAGHYFENQNILFSPLHTLEVGEFVYLTDLKQIYKYEVSEIQIIEATDVHIIEDIPNKKILTLITCADEGVRRLSVQADFESSYSYEEAPAELFGSF